MRQSFVRLKSDFYPFKKGTEFEVTGGDDGFYTDYCFKSGEVFVNGKKRRISVECKNCEYINGKEFTGAVIVDEGFFNPRPMTDSEFWSEWINSPG